MQDDEARERVMKLKREELDTALEKYMAKTDEDEAGAPALDTAPSVASKEAA